MALTAERTSETSLIICDGPETIAEIRDLRLCNVRFRPGGRILIGEEVPLPLFWQQYADHEDPERNAGSNGRLEIVETTGGGLTVVCRGSTVSESVESVIDAVFDCDRLEGRYTIDIRATLRIMEGHTWRVTRNPHHGEVEFCNIWPEGAFSAERRKALRYDGCYIDRGDQVIRVPHHHLESSDKHNIVLHAGDRLLWLLEEENLCVTLLSDECVKAGICAYMWDAHLGYSICGKEDVHVDQAGSVYEASFRLSMVDREEGAGIAESARTLQVPELRDTPVIVEGVHTFAETSATAPGDPADIWPWETEVISGDPAASQFLVDRTLGWDDGNSLCVKTTTPAQALWKATALGPAFRQPEFQTGDWFSLGAFVKADLQSGSATIAIRLHRSGFEGLYDPACYEVFACTTPLTATSGWTYLEVVTPPIRPAADRIHLLLKLEGVGLVWFDNVHFERKT